MSTANRWTHLGDTGGLWACSSFQRQSCAEMSTIHRFSKAPWRASKRLMPPGTVILLHCPHQCRPKGSTVSIKTVKILIRSQFYFIRCPALSMGWNVGIKQLQWANSTRQPLSCSFPSKLPLQRLFLCILNSENTSPAPFWQCLDLGETGTFFLLSQWEKHYCVCVVLVWFK